MVSKRTFSFRPDNYSSSLPLDEAKEKMFSVIIKIHNLNCDE
jgi:hypothetical protein